MTVSAGVFDYGLTSSSGIWTATSGGSSITGLNTNEVRWGVPAESQKSGLRFDGTGASTFNEGDTFLIGQLTHFNYPTAGGTAANGATLKVTLAFSNPTVSPNPEFTYNFAIEETSNSAGNCPGWQVSGTPCDDRITFPSSYGDKSFTIGDKLYTLMIVGFVNSYPSGTPVSYLITEEEHNTFAYLVGTLSSVLVAAPQITLVKKTTNGVEAETGSGPHILVGSSVAWEYFVQNTGNVDLTGIVVTDDQSVVVTCPKTTLTSGELMTCTGSGTAVFGQYANTATASGVHSITTYYSDPKASHYLGIYCESGDCCENYNFMPTGTSCTNGLFCDGAETCDALGNCQDRADPDCSANDLPTIATCTNIPDSKSFTWDAAAGFTSICSPATDSCTTGSYIYSHTCDVSTCGAECDDDTDCAATDCDYQDGCVGKDWYEYTDVANTCDLATSCACSANTCGAAVITPNDARCTDCQTDEDCNARDQVYCDGTIIKQDNGKCVNYECTTETTPVVDCDDDSWCNGAETCSAAACVAGTIRDCSDDLFCTVNEICDENNDRCTYTDMDCSGSDIGGISTCTNIPDDIAKTWDYRAVFASICDETNNVCTTGDDTITHTCDVQACNAECEMGNTEDNTYCPQSTTECQDKKQGTRDGFGECNLNCLCAPDSATNFQCVKDACGAECDSSDDCDDGNVNTIDGCLAGCTCGHEMQPYCGDGNVDAGEECEVGDSDSCVTGLGYLGTKTCDNSCSWGECIPGEFCGDDLINDGEICDDGSDNGLPNHCNADCTGTTTTTCGNNAVEAGEQCDDGNVVSGDGCNAVCVEEYCGDSITNDNTETCDDGSSNGLGCTPGGCGMTCNYCDSDCTTETNFGGICCNPLTECCYTGAPGCGDNPVPEFSPFALGLAIIGVGLGLTLLRKK